MTHQGLWSTSSPSTPPALNCMVRLLQSDEEQLFAIAQMTYSPQKYVSSVFPPQTTLVEKPLGQSVVWMTLFLTERPSIVVLLLLKEDRVLMLWSNAVLSSSCFWISTTRLLGGDNTFSLCQCQSNQVVHDQNSPYMTARQQPLPFRQPCTNLHH